MTTSNRIIVPSAIAIALLIHAGILLLPFSVASPDEVQEPTPEFAYIDAVMVETPPEPEILLEQHPSPPPVREPVEPPPEIVEVQEMVETISDAVDLNDDLSDIDLPDPPERVPLIVEEPAPRPVEVPVEPVSEVAAAGETPPAPPVNRRVRRPIVEPEVAEVVQPTPQPAEEVFLPFYQVEKRPEFVNRAPLRYPPQAARQRIEGVVIVEADIDAQGRIVDTRVVREAGFGFEEAAIEMLTGSVFSPAIIGGRPVAVRMRFTIEFRLN